MTHRAIYVGESQIKRFSNEIYRLDYGSTGYAECEESPCIFMPDTLDGGPSFGVERNEIYRPGA